MAKIIEPGAETAQAIRELYAVTNRLGALYPGRHFTPDGHMVGSLGEVVAAEHYGLKLFTASEAWEAAGKPQKTSQRSISLVKLRELNAGVAEEDRIGTRGMAGDCTPTIPM
ncbi:DUF6998 domain-containing protein [Caniella muris]|uniref:DUF6998 domain-containing protein n=1 Tax=Caniella muris TaxID=2941502 RepID=UPI00203D310D|nr:hypothetical protein [Caniella muris]